jgi:dihydrofolate reductase
MRKLVVLESLSLDGVMQAPGRPDEDTRGGFSRGGWAVPFRDHVMGAAMASGIGETGPLLFGRRTYQDFFKVWPSRTHNPYSAVLDNAEKLVASRTLREPLPWKNSTLLGGDAVDTVAALKARPGKSMLVMGSGVLVGSLLGARLVDEMILLIHPLLLGEGRQLFPRDGPPAALDLVSTTPTTTGVLMATYRLRGAPAGDSVGAQGHTR